MTSQTKTMIKISSNNNNDKVEKLTLTTNILQHHQHQQRRQQHHQQQQLSTPSTSTTFNTININNNNINLGTHVILLSELFEDDVPLLVLAPFVLKPNSDDPGVKTSHLDQLLLHQGIRSWVDRVASPQGVELAFVEYGPYSSRLGLGLEWIVGVRRWRRWWSSCVCCSRRGDGVVVLFYEAYSGLALISSKILH